MGRSHQSSEICSIAVVDGDPSSRSAAAFALGAEDVSIRVFESAENFLQDLSLQAYSCLVIDANLPGMSGMELQSYLNATGNKTPVVMYSDCADMASARAALTNGAAQFVTKPLDPQLLREIVCEATHHRANAIKTPDRQAA